MQTMSEAQLSTRDVASRLGISTSDLAELRLKTGELPIEQDGLKLFYSAETVQAFERSEALKVMERVLASQSPLATLTRMAQVSGLTRLYIAGQLVAPTIENPTQSSSIEQLVKLEKEMSQVQTQYKDAEQNYGSDLLNLVVAKGYLTKLLVNDAVKSYILRHEPEILEQFELVANTVSMEEALHQQEIDLENESTDDM